MERDAFRTSLQEKRFRNTLDAETASLKDSSRRAFDDAKKPEANRDGHKTGFPTRTQPGCKPGNRVVGPEVFEPCPGIAATGIRPVGMAWSQGPPRV